MVKAMTENKAGVLTVDLPRARRVDEREKQRTKTSTNGRVSSLSQERHPRDGDESKPRRKT